MQDLLAMGGGGGGGGRIFTGDRRLRPQPNQAMKCPRCDSLNTKFCYYNNYNLSQPRHFCKSCRRYWTKGGVLRNVPVGGGCRKNKRSKPKPSQDPHKERKSTSHSSSESSSLTATTTTTTMTTTMTTEAASLAPSTNSAPALLNFDDSRLFISQNYNVNPNFEPSMLDTLDQPSDVGIYPESGTFTGLMTASNPALLGFNFSNASPFRLHHQQQVTHRPHDMKMQEVTAGFVDQTVPTTQHQQLKMTNMIEEMKINQELMTGFVDQTVPVELAGMQNSAGNGEGLTELDWPSSGDQGLYELASSVDQGYWNQNQWADNDHPLYLP